MKKPKLIHKAEREVIKIFIRSAFLDGEINENDFHDNRALIEKLLKLSRRPLAFNIDHRSTILKLAGTGAFLGW
jgi:hypothetical protein